MGNFLKNITLSFKIVAVASILAGVFLGSSVGYIVMQTRGALIDSQLSVLKTSVESERARIGGRIDEVSNILLAITGTPPIQGIIRANKNNGVDSFENSTLEQWRKRLGAIFSVEASSVNLFAQIRLIDSEGNEVVRVNYDYDNAEIVQKDLLQNKRTTEYFIKTSSLKEGEIYVSNAELNREGAPSKISEPYTPVVRYATPIFDEETGSFAGIIVLNVLVDKLVKNASVPIGEKYIIDKEGFFISHPDKNKEWGGPVNLDTGYSMQTEFPSFSVLNSEVSEDAFTKDGNIVVYAQIVDHASGDEEVLWSVVEILPLSVVMGPINKNIQRTALIGSGTFVLLFIAFLFSIRFLLRPLKTLVYGAESVGSGDFDTKIPVTTNDEIGKVGQAFNSMVLQIKSSYSILEEKVSEKTKDLRNNLESLEKAKLATVNVLEDMAEEKKKLEAVSDRLSLATQAAHIGIWDWDTVNNVLVWDDQMYVLYGINKDSFSGAYEAWQEGVHPEDLKASDLDIQAALKGTKEFNTDFRVIWPNKSVHEIRAFAIVKRNDAGEPIRMIGVNWDITHEKEVDRAKSEFVSLASHQLRTPLSTINWYSEMLLDGDAGKLNKQQTDYLSEIYKGNKRMVELVNSLLNVSRIELGTFAVDPEEVDVISLVQETVKETGTKAIERDQKISVECDKEIPIINADPKLLRMIFTNFITNAIKYTPEKGSIKIVLKNIPKGEKVNEKASKEDGFLYSVSDTGYGIPKSEQSHIFEKLFRADNIQKMDTEGTGLGLYIVKAIIQKIHGSVWFESKEGEGTTFSVWIPLSGMGKAKGDKKLT